MRIVLVGGCAGVGALAGAWAAWLAFRLAVPPDAAPVSRCPHCREALPAGWRGWLRLGGRCPACRRLTVRSWAYVAAATAGFAALAWRLPADRPAEVVLLIAWLLVAGAGTVLAGIDVAVHRLPRPILAAAAAAIGPLVATASVCAHDPGLLLRAGLTAAAFGGGYLILARAGTGPGH